MRRSTAVAPARPSRLPTPGTGTIEGVICLAGHAEPIAYADIIVEGTRIGSMSDEDGRFVITSVPLGRVTLLSKTGLSPNHRDTVEVVAGRFTPVTIRIVNRFTRARDSLERIGRWPPTVDSITVACIRANLELTVRPFSPADFRSVPAASADSLERGRGRRLPLAVRDSLLAALQAADFVSPLHGIKLFCICTPEVRVVSHGAAPLVRIDLCFECGTVSIQQSGRSQFAYFGSGAAGFDRLRSALGMPPGARSR